MRLRIVIGRKQWPIIAEVNQICIAICNEKRNASDVCWQTVHACASVLMIRCAPLLKMTTHYLCLFASALAYFAFHAEPAGCDLNPPRSQCIQWISLKMCRFNGESFSWTTWLQLHNASCNFNSSLNSRRFYSLKIFISYSIRGVSIIFYFFSIRASRFNPVQQFDGVTVVLVSRQGWMITPPTKIDVHTKRLIML